ncbi:MAG: hypothetical protein AAGF11_34795 [Myxococcota bacterium]
MSEQGRDSHDSHESVDEWFDEAASRLHANGREPVPAWPPPQRLPAPWRSHLPRPATVAYATFLLLMVAATLVGRVDAALVGVASFVAIVAVAPHLLHRGQEDEWLGADLATSLRRESEARAFNRRAWRLSAITLLTACMLCLAATGYAYRLHADSPVSYWQAAPLRWAALLTTVALCCALAYRRSRSSGRSVADARELEDALELADAAEGGTPPRHTGAPLLAGVIAMSVALAAAQLVGPTNLGDSPGRVLVIGDDATTHARWLHERFGLEAEGLTPDQAWARADELFSGERGQLESLTHLADLQGVGFVLVDLGELEVDAEGRSDLSLAGRKGEQPAFASIATGDVAVLEYAAGFGGAPPGRSRSRWFPLGPLPVALGGGEAWMPEDAAERLALARSLFAQPAFHFPDFDHPERPPEFNGRSQTLLRGVLYFGLAPDFWTRATERYTDMETAISSKRVPLGLTR